MKGQGRSSVGIYPPRANLITFEMSELPKKEGYFVNIFAIPNPKWQSGNFKTHQIRTEWSDFEV